MDKNILQNIFFHVTQKKESHAGHCSHVSFYSLMKHAEILTDVHALRFPPMANYKLLGFMYLCNLHSMLGLISNQS